MKFAKFWKEIDVSVDKSFFGHTQVSIWGASNDSNEDARNNAELRARKFEKLISSNSQSIQDYEYWNGYIKEEVVEEILSSDGRLLAVLTRNSYGALVLNTESVFFGDIDVVESNFITRILEKFGKTKKDKAYYIEKVKDFQKMNQKYTIKVYETFAGLRIVIINQLFDSNSPEVSSIFSSLDTDPLYVMLCKHQSCFRARLSPKPWRVGIDRPKSRFPRSSQEKKDNFEKWLTNYKNVSTNFGVTRLLKTYGADRSHSDVERVMSIHDKYTFSVSRELA